VSIPDIDKFKVFLPIGTFLIERGVAETDLNPPRDTVFAYASILHVVEVFIASHRSATQRSGLDCRQQGSFSSGLDACFHQIAHRER
jgi:hypothetical protein